MIENCLYKTHPQTRLHHHRHTVCLYIVSRYVSTWAVERTHFLTLLLPTAVYLSPGPPTHYTGQLVQPLSRQTCNICCYARLLHYNFLMGGKYPPEPAGWGFHIDAFFGICVMSYSDSGKAGSTSSSAPAPFENASFLSAIYFSSSWLFRKGYVGTTNSLGCHSVLSYYV